MPLGMSVIVNAILAFALALILWFVDVPFLPVFLATFIVLMVVSVVFRRKRT